LPDGLCSRLHRHLFSGDHDEHAAVIAAGLAETPRGVRLLARELHLAVDGVDYVPGKRGYRMLKASFIRKRITACRDERLVYLAIHNHGGHDRVAFSDDDMRSHERGYPALLDIARGMPVGALVFAENAVAGDIWLPGEARVELAGASIVGNSLRRLTPTPRNRTAKSDVMYDRQARLFGDAGQDILAHAKIGIIGLGGAGSLLAEYLGRLGVGEFVLADPDRAELSNLPRLTAASRFDAMAAFADEMMPAWLRRHGIRLARRKVTLARRNIRRANPRARIDAIFGNFLDTEIATKFIDWIIYFWRPIRCAPDCCLMRSSTSISSPAFKSAQRSGLIRPRVTYSTLIPSLTHHLGKRMPLVQRPHQCRQAARGEHFRRRSQKTALRRRPRGRCLERHHDECHCGVAGCERFSFLYDRLTRPDRYH
jgi:ThiF family